MNKKKIFKSFLFLIYCCCCFIIGRLYFIVYSSNTSFNQSSVNIFISNRFTFEEVLAELKPYLNSLDDFILASKFKNYDKKIKSGKYKIVKGLNNNQIINLLNSKSLTVQITFNNQERLENLAGRISAQIDSDSLTLIDSFKDSIFLKKENFNKNNALSMYLPNTYEFYWNTSAIEFRERMLLEYKIFWTENRINKAKSQNLTPIQISVIASIVQKETIKVEERPLVAGVYLNRIKRKMKLQADPTVIYSLKLINNNFDTIIKRVLFSDLKINSKYNTYRNRDLPPGPICMPDISSIEAVLSPKKHSYLYFVVNPENPGYHSFSKSLSTHNIFKKKYINWLNKKRLYR